MTQRERFLGAVRYEETDRPPPVPGGAVAGDLGTLVRGRLASGLPERQGLLLRTGKR